ncbi:hypothetical protein GCM10007862_11830 [Dyella lipolytica]|uniref:Outer membrane beta-barrel protein n=1 Tax=Dyella lipolytica TaxID=1867835 RepID=A0ABW8IUE5_9GAMM|nr:outer membrane beta-barrel protein [Dyella lipolytica]GLQ46132.1 hypothetical protein GCM10007862_11830 [Dyella lipolytica]
MPSPTKLAGAVMLILGLASGKAAAAQFDYTLYSGLERNDNVNESATNQIGKNILDSGVSFSLAQAGSTLQANAAGDLEYLDYFGKGIKNQLFGQLNGNANWVVLPQRLDMTIQDYAGVQPVSTLTSNAPSNLQQTNVVALGPTLYFRLGETLHGQGELRYINSYASKASDFNSSRGQAALRLFKDLDPTDQLSANVEDQHVDFQNNTSSPNYDRVQAFARYDRKLTNLDLGVALGWSQIDFTHGPTKSTPLGLLSVNWQATPRNSFTFLAEHEYADAADDLMAQPNQYFTNIGNNINIGDTEVNSDVYLERTLQASYAFNTERFTLNVAPLYRKLDYLTDNTLNLTGRGFSSGLSYKLREDLTLSAFANYEKRNYDVIDRHDKFSNYGVSLLNQRTPHWAIRLALSRIQLSSSTPLQGYQSNVIYIGVVYTR